MISDRRVALVTGANRGIGFEIVRKLCKEFDGDVYLTARNVERGKLAVETLRQEGLNPKFHQLDIVDANSIERIRVYLKAYYGGVDVLVNNAAVSHKRVTNTNTTYSEEALNTVKTNFFGTLELCEALFPLLRPHARVVNIASLAARVGIKKCRLELRKRLTSPDMTLEDLQQEIENYARALETNTQIELGWNNSPYAVTKIGIVLLTFLQQKELEPDPRKDIIVNTCCPGIVSSERETKCQVVSAEEASDTPVYLALLPENVNEPIGQYVSKRQVQAWG